MLAPLIRIPIGPIGPPTVGPVFLGQPITSGVGSVMQPFGSIAVNAGTSYGTLPAADNGYGVNVPTAAGDNINATLGGIFSNMSPTMILVILLVGWLLVRK